MRNFCAATCAAILALCLAVAARAGTTSSPQGQQNSQTESARSPANHDSQAAQNVTGYTLPTDRYKKARDLARIRFRLQLVDILYGLLVLWMILHWKIAPAYRNWAERTSQRQILQGLLFGPLIILTMDLFDLPTEIYGHSISRRYGLSVQGWPSWAWDQTKGEAVSIIGGTILLLVLYAVIRKSPRRWWFYFWVVSLPIIVFVIFLQPLVVDPLFHRFEPLAQKDPALTAALEQMVRRTGKHIPPERMFWMGAAEKSTEIDAYVTGVGSSKRIVVWDTTIADLTQPEIVFVTGHEMGHYVLNHIPKGVAFYSVFLLVAFYLGYRSIGWTLAKWGVNWAIRGVDDWASLPVLLLLLSIFSIAADPIENAFSRHVEHQADQYGLEVTHGLTPDAGQVAARAFEALGNIDLDDPEPNPVDVFLFYTHPTIEERIHFALTYDPWAHGARGEFVH